VNLNFLRNKKWNLQKDIGPRILGMERTEAKNKKKSDTHKIAQPKINSNQNRTGPTAQDNGSLTGRYWPFSGCSTSGFLALPFTVLVGRGMRD